MIYQNDKGGVGGGLFIFMYLTNKLRSSPGLG